MAKSIKLSFKIAVIIMANTVSVFAMNFIIDVFLEDELMEYFIGILLFIIGTLLGSFCTLAVYRIPLGKDIIHERSFCPNCSHKLAFFDLIPVLSYIFLRGKCRYCNQKIRIRYLFLEIFSGLMVLLFALSLNIDFTKISSLIYLFLGIMYMLALTLIAGIDKQYCQIQKGVLLFGLSVIILYILYLYVIEPSSIYRYAIYLFVMLLIIMLDNWYMKKKNKTSYTLQILMLCVLLMIFSGTECFVYSVILTLISIAIYTLYKKKKKQENIKIPIGFLLCIFSIASLILQNFLMG